MLSHQKKQERDCLTNIKDYLLSNLFDVTHSPSENATLQIFSLCGFPFVCSCLIDMVLLCSRVYAIMLGVCKCNHQEREGTPFQHLSLITTVSCVCDSLSLSIAWNLHNCRDVVESIRHKDEVERRF